MISLKKGDEPVTLTKTKPGDTATLTCSWSSDTDYDLYAIVVYADGTFEYIATFPAGKRTLMPPAYPAKAATSDGAVRHLGDVQRGHGGTGTETVEIAFNDNIAAVIPVVYSAQSNGTGSFRRYRVSTEIVCGSQKVHIGASHASDDDHIYTLVPGMIGNMNGVLTVSPLEEYSPHGSENRPTVTGTGIHNGLRAVVLDMDGGPRNCRK